MCKIATLSEIVFTQLVSTFKEKSWTSFKQIETPHLVTVCHFSHPLLLRRKEMAILQYETRRSFVIYPFLETKIRCAWKYFKDGLKFTTSVSWEQAFQHDLSVTFQLQHWTFERNYLTVHWPSRYSRRKCIHWVSSSLHVIFCTCRTSRSTRNESPFTKCGWLKAVSLKNIYKVTIRWTRERRKR